MLRHSSITITADTYTSVLPDVARQAAEAAIALVPRAGVRPGSAADQVNTGAPHGPHQAPPAGPAARDESKTAGQQCRALSRARRGSRRFREWARVLGGLWSARSAMACSAPASSWSALVRSRSAPANPPGPRPDDQAKLAADSPMSRPPLLDRQRRGWPGRGGHPASHRVAGNLRVRRVGRPGIEPGTRGLKVRCSAS